MNEVPKLRPASTVLSMSQRFAAIQKNSPLGSINLNAFVENSRPVPSSSNQQQQQPEHDGPYAQYRPQEYSMPSQYRPIASLQQGSAQNQLILQKLQRLMGHSSEMPLPSRTISAFRDIPANHYADIKRQAAALHSRRPRDMVDDDEYYEQEYRSPSPPPSPPRRMRQPELIPRARGGIARKLTARDHARYVAQLRAESEERWANAPPPTVPTVARKPMKATGRLATSPQKAPEKKKSLAERLGPISVFNRLGDGSKKPSIHDRISFDSESSVMNIIPSSKQKINANNNNTNNMGPGRSLKDRLSGLGTARTFKSNVRLPGRKPNRQETGKGKATGRKFTTEDLDDDLDAYMAD